jgi:hypothetical protein
MCGLRECSSPVYGKARGSQKSERAEKGFAEALFDDFFSLSVVYYAKLWPKEK